MRFFFQTKSEPVRVRSSDKAFAGWQKMDPGSLRMFFDLPSSDFRNCSRTPGLWLSHLQWIKSVCKCIRILVMFVLFKKKSLCAFFCFSECWWSPLLDASTLSTTMAWLGCMLLDCQIQYLLLDASTLSTTMAWLGCMLLDCQIQYLLLDVSTLSTTMAWLGCRFVRLSNPVSSVRCVNFVFYNGLVRLHVLRLSYPGSKLFSHDRYSTSECALE